VADKIDSEEKLKSTLPRMFISRCIRVFCKNADVCGAVGMAFALWAAEQDGACHIACLVVTSTRIFLRSRSCRLDLREIYHTQDL
jgi:hypothetical protein